MQDQLEKKMETLQQEIKRNTAAEAGQIFSDFAKQNNVNVTVERAGSEVLIWEWISRYHCIPMPIWFLM